MGVLMYRPEFEAEVTNVDLLLARIAKQNAVVASAYAGLSKLFSGDLQKLANADDLTKRLIASKALLGEVNAEIDVLKNLTAECAEAQDRARRAAPDLARYASEGRELRSFFVAGKNAPKIPFSTGGEQSIPAADVADAMLARRFSQR
jgi:hypothetical protein